MSQLNRQQRVDLYRSLFRGREDVFAYRWEQADTEKSGYAPAYADQDKSNYRSLTQQDIENHLLGHSVLGIYPLLKNNHSWFIAADFDKGNWREDATRFREVCRQYDISVAVEISRSGNGAHVWCFFDSEYVASYSRKVFLSLLSQAGCIDEYAPLESFDRLFPNQDIHAGKGLGNLIALPLQGASRKEGKTVFVKPGCFTPYPDQWAFLLNLKRLSTSRLDELYQEVAGSGESPAARQLPVNVTEGVLQIKISNVLKMPKQSVPPKLVTFLRENLNFLNSEYFAKSRSGLSTHTIEKYFKTVTIDDNFVYVPRGYLATLETFLRDEGIVYEVKDCTTVIEPIDQIWSLDLYEGQQTAVSAFKSVNQGVLVAPPGSGKTLMGLAIAMMKQQPTLIITHRQNIFSQWVDCIENFLGLTKKEIGRYACAQKKVKQPFTVAMIQTLARSDDLKNIVNQFGCVIIDECHHVPAKSFRKVVSLISSRFLFGLTATPKRQYNDEKLIYAYLGNVVTILSPQSVLYSQGDDTEKRTVTIKILSSKFTLPYKISVNDFAHVQKLLAHDIGRNKLIAQQIESEIELMRRVLVLCQRTEHVDALWYFLKGKIDIFTMKGSLSTKQKRYRMNRIQNGTFQVVIATTQLFSEGVDVGHFDSLFLVSPYSYEGKVIQQIGRLRGGGAKKVFDIEDTNMPLLMKSFKKRMALYRKMAKTEEVDAIVRGNTLFD